MLLHSVSNAIILMEYFLNTYMERSRESVGFLQSREHCRLQPTNGAENILIGETAVLV